MATKHLNIDEEYTLAEVGTELYIKRTIATTGGNFARQPGNVPVNPYIEEMVSTHEQDISIVNDTYLTDNNLNDYWRIVGGRPKGTRRK